MYLSYRSQVLTSIHIAEKCTNISMNFQNFLNLLSKQANDDIYLLSPGHKGSFLL